METRPPSPAGGVGPVLSCGPEADAIVAAIRAENDGARVVDRGSYLRVVVPGRCRVTRAAIEAALGRPFRLPGDLERAMTSFSGRFQVSEDEATWDEATSINPLAGPPIPPPAPPAPPAGTNQ